MPADHFQEFLASPDALRVYVGDMLAYASQKDGLLPLMDYLAAYGAICQKVIIYDKVMGNAAALLSVRAGASEVYSPLGSKLAVATLEKHKVKYHLTAVVPCIMRDDGKGMCPMEELSQGKEPGEFYRVMRARLGQSV